MANNFQISDRIEINLDAVITSNGSMLSAWAGGEVVAVTEKAVKLQAITENGKEITCWFPKKALQVFSGNRTNPFDNQTSHYVTLARWFRLNDQTSRFLNLARDSHTLRA
jgi:hypothetical protein